MAANPGAKVSAAHGRAYLIPTFPLLTLSCRSRLDLLSFLFSKIYALETTAINPVNAMPSPYLRQLRGVDGNAFCDTRPAMFEFDLSKVVHKERNCFMLAVHHLNNSRSFRVVWLCEELAACRT